MSKNKAVGIKRAKYGDGLIANLSEKLTAEFGNGFSVRNLRAMRQFYLLFPRGCPKRVFYTSLRGQSPKQNVIARSVATKQFIDNQIWIASPNGSQRRSRTF
ncbi:MAG: DUF1016 N-terminal domain-containing protein [Prevotellaceae bacterium]|nr:DUF1016 N-terminal domain-containing protein [Prevotellaceae bacterium]